MGCQVFCDSGVTLDYDHLLVAAALTARSQPAMLALLGCQVGAQPNTFGIPGVDKYGRQGTESLRLRNVMLPWLAQGS